MYGMLHEQKLTSGGQMAKFRLDDEVYVPSSILTNPSLQPHALTLRKVLATHDRSITVDDVDGSTVDVGSARVHDSSIGFVIIRVGDLATESALLDPLAKSVLQFLRLLVPDDHVRLVNVRTLSELGAFWTANHAGCSHVILIGHAGAGTISFLDAGDVSGAAFAAALATAAPAVTEKFWASLACSSGRQNFAKAFSESSVCSHLVAPYGVVHGAAASHFCQSFFLTLLLKGSPAVSSFNSAASVVMGETHFRLWQNGRIAAGKALK
jgi:hypothetical protein